MQKVSFHDLEEVEEKYGDFLFFHQGKPFTGETFDEFEGYTYYRSFKDGYQDGSSTAFYPSGAKFWQSEFQEGTQVGDYYEWYESGQLKSYEKHEIDAYVALEKKKWLENGTLILEVNHKDKISREWYSTGELQHEEIQDHSILYGFDGEWAVKYKGENFYIQYDKNNDISWNDKVLKKDYRRMLDEGLSSYIYQWLHLKLERDYDFGVSLLCDLIQYPDFDVQATAISIAGNARVKESIPFIEAKVNSKLQSPDESSGMSGTLGDHAKRVLLALTIQDKKKLERVYEEQGLAQERKKKRRILIDKIKKPFREIFHFLTWKETIAVFQQSYEQRFTLKTLESWEDLFPTEDKSEFDGYLYSFYYEYKNKTYMANHRSHKSVALQKGEQVKILVNPKHPEQYLFPSLFHNLAFIFTIFLSVALSTLIYLLIVEAR